VEAEMKCLDTTAKILMKAYEVQEAGESSPLNDHLLNCPSCTKDDELLASLIRKQRAADGTVKIPREADIRILGAAHEALEKPEKNPWLLRLAIPAMSAAAFFILAFLFTPIFHKGTTIMASGSISMNDHPLKGWKPAQGPMRVDVPKGSKAIIENTGNYRIVLRESSTFSYSDRSGNDLALTLMNGDADFKIRKNFGHVEITTINGVVRVTGTTFTLKVDKNPVSTSLDLEEGSVQFWNRLTPENILSMHAGQRAMTTGMKPPVLTIVQNPLNQEKTVRPRMKPPAVKSSIKEKIHLRNGNIIIGHIVSQKEGKLTLRTSFGVLTYDNSDVEKIEYLP
jgi:hypothetical protein